MPAKRKFKRHLNLDETQPEMSRTTKYNRLQLNQVKKNTTGEMLFFILKNIEKHFKINSTLTTHFCSNVIYDGKM